MKKLTFKNINNRGAAVLLFSIIISFVIFYLMMTLNQKYANMLNVKAKTKVYNDVQIAIDYFGSELKRAYDLAASVPDNYNRSLFDFSGSNYLSDEIQLKDFEDNPSSISIKMYLPGVTGVDDYPETDDNQLCINRSDSFNILSSGNVKAICIKTDESLSHLLKSAIGTKSYAQQLENKYDPGDVSSTFTPVTVTNLNTGEARFQNRYFGNLNCDQIANNYNNPAGGFFCLKVKICPKIILDCEDEEFLHSGMVFMRPPTTQL